MHGITTHMINVYAWMALGIYWCIGAFFTHSTQATEGFLRRMIYFPLEILALVLLVHDRRAPFIHGEFFDIPWTEWLGTAITLAGLLFAAWARIHLGHLWSGQITLKEGHRIVRTGPYRITRHPIYTGLLTASVGTALSASTVEAILGCTLLTVAFIIKHRREDAWLTKAFGDEYRTYQQQVPALVPFIY